MLERKLLKLKKKMAIKKTWGERLDDMILFVKKIWRK